jgi:NADH-quinone oxidoreductase subunit E
MKRYDLRPLKENFYARMLELLQNDIQANENAIFLFEIGDFTPIQKVADLVKENDYTLMNSLKFNEVDWTVVIKKAKDESLTNEPSSEEANEEPKEEA